MNFTLRCVALKARATKRGEERAIFSGDVLLLLHPLAAALIFGLVLHCVPQFERLFIQQQQIVGDRQQMRLRLLGFQTRGPSLLFAQLVFQLIEDLLHVPATAIEFGEHARRQIRLVGQKLLSLAGDRIDIADQAQTMAVAGFDPHVFLPATIARVGCVPRPTLLP